MRIAFVTETWHPGLDGVVVRLHHTVTDLVGRGHEVLVVAPTVGPPAAGVRQRRTRGLVIPMIDRSRPWGMPDRRIASMLADFGPDVVHVVNPVLMGSVALPRLAGRYPLVASFHTDIASYVSRYRLQWARPTLRYLTRRAYAVAHVRLATSATGVRLVTELDAGEVSLWPPGVDESMFERDRSSDTPGAADGRYPADPGPRRTHVVCVGRLAREKNLDLLRDVLVASVGSVTPLHLSFVGDGPDRSRLERLYQGTPASFVGVLRGSALAAAYRAADVLAFTSTTETVGLVLLEARAIDLPVVAVTSPAARDTLAGYDRAVLVAADAPPSRWLEAITTAQGSPPTPLTGTPGTNGGGVTTWQHATDLLLSAYELARTSHAHHGRPA